MEKIDIKTVNGHLFTCNSCNKIHFEFNQINIDFSSINIANNFFNHLSSIDGNLYESLNNETGFNRKIHIPFPNTTIKMVLSIMDLEELKILFSTFISNYKTQETEALFIKNLTTVSHKQLN